METGLQEWVGFVSNQAEVKEKAKNAENDLRVTWKDHIETYRGWQWYDQLLLEMSFITASGFYFQTEI